VTLALLRLAAHVTHDPVRLFLEFGVPQTTQTRHAGSTGCFGCRTLRSVVSNMSHVKHLAMFSGTMDLQFQHGPIYKHSLHIYQSQTLYFCSFGAFTLLVGRQKGHLASNHGPIPTIPKKFHSGTNLTWSTPDHWHNHILKWNQFPLLFDKLPSPHPSFQPFSLPLIQISMLV